MRSALSAVLGAVPALELVLATLIGGTLIGWSGTAVAASSRDYPGPCAGETVASGVPLFLAADYHGANPVYGVVILSDTGRFRLGISCVATASSSSAWDRIRRSARCAAAARPTICLGSPSTTSTPCAPSPAR